MINLTRVETRLRQIRNKNEDEHLRRLREIKARYPIFDELEKREQKIGYKLARYALESKDISPLIEESKEILKEKEKLLSSGDYPPNYLDPIYDCEICKDTGADGTRICSCKKRMMINELYSMSGIEEIVKYQNFENFDMDLFRPSKSFDEALSPRQMIELYLAQAKTYVRDFPTNKEKNLYFYGPVGTGKTYMCNCIAKEIMDKGYSVVYQTSSKLLNFIGDYNFSSQDNKARNKSKYDLLRTCDLLIIDDLGTEVNTSVASSNLFELVNERLLVNKATIISSNLDYNDIRQEYDERIYSRLVGNFNMVNFFGDDLRKQKYT